MRAYLLPTLSIAFILALWGCDRGRSDTPRQSGGDRPTEVAASESPEHGHDEGHDEERVAEEQRAETGLASAVTAGQAPSEEIELVEATVLLADPERFSGRTVRVRGSIKGFCVHARAWYAIDVPGGSPPYIRVLALPAFRVPEGAMGAEVLTQGTVELVTLPASRVRHFEEHHQLGSGDDPPGTAEVTRVAIRATGAVFSPASAPSSSSTPAPAPEAESPPPTAPGPESTQE